MADISEDTMQIQVIEFVKQCTNLPVFHIPNQRQTSMQHGSKLKRMGVLSGVSDLFFPRSNHSHKGMFLELKTLKGKPTLNQIQFLADMEKEGYFGVVCYGSKEAIDTIKIFYGL